jgi:spore germination cell wall hydrolase CwlJ-like protein
MARRAGGSRPLAIPLLLAAIALLSVLVPALIVTHARRLAGRSTFAYLPQRVVPRSELPPVEPVRLLDLSPDAARAYNAERPLVANAVVPARPFQFPGGADDRARAVDCLAAAAIYEAGDDTIGERAVAQVILNRVRHPAYPKTVCGVAFEGSDRSTGCQFTFTCDGALARWQPSEAGWRRAREVAEAALAGRVDGEVGYATHYHADYVVPYWQASLDKIARVGAHLFFRWTGWWGTPPAFSHRATGVEPVIAKLAALSPAHGGGVTVAGDAVVPGVPFFGRTLRPLVGDPDTFLTTLDPRQPPDSYRTLAVQACGERVHCKVLGWTDPSAMAFTMPVSAEAQAALSFSYLRDRTSGFDRALWNCTEFKAAPPGACMKRQPARPAAAATPSPGLIVDEHSDDELGGVRRRNSAPAAAATPTP